MTDRPPEGVPAGMSDGLGQVKNLIKMLRHDMEGVAECRCRTHGGTGAGLNFTITLLCLVACEVAGVLRYGNPKNPGQAAERFLRDDVAAAARDDRYESAARLIIKFFRDGVAHSFLPKSMNAESAVPQPSIVRGVVLWGQDDELGPVPQCVSPLGRTAAAALDQLYRLRRDYHLKVHKGFSSRDIQVVAQVLYVDVDEALSEFLGKLDTNEVLQRCVVKNFYELDAESARRTNVVDWSFVVNT